MQSPLLVFTVLYKDCASCMLYLHVFSLSQSTINSSVLNSSQLGDSPFYPGKTTYGGAAAAKAARSRPGTPYQVSISETLIILNTRRAKVGQLKQMERWQDSGLTDHLTEDVSRMLSASSFQHRAIFPSFPGLLFTNLAATSLLFLMTTHPRLIRNILYGFVCAPQAPVRRQIKAKPAGAQPCGVTSATARRILQSLERMSSPLAVSAFKPVLNEIGMQSRHAS